jgi:hypothetical protein
MYLIFYQKRNGEVICRIRNTMPQTSIGKETSMGWKVVDIKQRFKNSYYSFSECNKLENNRIKKYRFIKNIKSYFNKYAIQLIFILILFFLLKKN